MLTMICVHNSSRKTRGQFFGGRVIGRPTWTLAMLKFLHIKDFAIIDELDCEFGEGLNVMTGETGAGKTIIVHALKFVLGGRVSLDMIREGSQKTAVTAVFRTKGIDPNVLVCLSAAGIECGDELVINRVVNNQGKGKISLNGSPVAASVLKDVGKRLVDLSSQHEHQILLDRSSHGAIIDAFGALEKFALEYRSIHGDYVRVLRGLSDLKANEKAAKDKLDFLKFQYDELAAADLKPGEDLKIEEERARLKNKAFLEERVRAAEEIIYGAEASGVEVVDRALKLIMQCIQFEPQAERWIDAMNRARAELKDLSSEMQSYLNSLESNSGRLEELDERLHLIRRLLKKHGGPIESLINRRDEILHEMEKIHNYDDIVANKQSELEGISVKRREVAKKWSGGRKKAALALANVVKGHLFDLGMKKVEFKASVELRPEVEWDENGADSAGFFFSPNVGESMKPLEQIASGGELSRVLLAVKSALGDRAMLAVTTVFDEVDSGIGGAVAGVVGLKLKESSAKRQVICITHLPQVAVHGRRHLRIIKRVQGGRTIASVRELAADERVEEIARMLSGAKITEASIAHAKEMLGHAI